MDLTHIIHRSDALDELQLKRYCCRRMVLTHVDLIEKLLHYNRASVFGFEFTLATYKPAAGFISNGENKRQGQFLREPALVAILLLYSLHTSPLYLTALTFIGLALMHTFRPRSVKRESIFVFPYDFCVWALAADASRPLGSRYAAFE